MKPRSLRSLGPVKSSTFFLRRQNGDHDTGICNSDSMMVLKQGQNVLIFLMIV